MPDFFSRWVDRATAIPKVGLPIGNSVSENFSYSRGDLMTVEDSRDEGGVAGVRYDH